MPNDSDDAKTLALPLTRVSAPPIEVVLSLNCTVPPIVPVKVLVTAAVKVTAPVHPEGFSLETSVVVVGAFTIWANIALSLP